MVICLIVLGLKKYKQNLLCSARLNCSVLCAEFGKAQITCNMYTAVKQEDVPLCTKLTVTNVLGSSADL